MFTISGILAIPSDPQLNIVKPESSSGFFFNFKAVTQGKVVNDTPDFHRWDVMVWVPEVEKDKWENDYIKPGSILFIEYGQALSIASQDGKYHHTKIKLEHSKVKKLIKPLWIKE